MKLLLVVERAFFWRDRREVEITLPESAAGTMPRLPATVLLKRPDGATRTVRIRQGQLHVNRPYAERSGRPPWLDVLRLCDVAPGEVPDGTEIWYEPDEPGEADGERG